jgi:hypothetical protein
MHQTHWGDRAWRANLDETALDPRRPQAFPAARAADLMGRLRVRLLAEERDLVACGYGGQRIVIPAPEIGAVHTVNSYRTGIATRSQALLVLDKHNRILLRAAGLWETYGEVARVCRAIGAPAPSHELPSYSRVTRGRRTRSVRVTPVYLKAPGYRRLRTRPRGAALLTLAGVAIFLAVAGAAGFIGTVPAILLPEWTGKVRVLIGMIGCTLGVAAGAWLFQAMRNVLRDGVRWVIASVQGRGAAPAARFFRRRGSSPRWSGLLNLGLIVMIPLLVIWGPGLAIVSGVHGVSDSHLVAELRADGVRTAGALIDVPQYSTDSGGNTTVTDVPTLSFTADGQQWQDTDPAIGGQPLPLYSGDPIATHVPLTVVYDRYDPGTAAALGQITGSVWHGAPTANVISGIVLTLALPALIWLTVVRIRRQRLRNAGLLSDIATPAS